MGNQMRLEAVTIGEHSIIQEHQIAEHVMEIELWKASVNPDQQTY